MFNLLGIGERAGSGLENIQLAWKEQEWLAPDLEELYNPDRIVLTLRTISMLPEQSIILLKSVLKDKYNELSREEVMALVVGDQEEYVTNNRLQQLLNTHAINSNKILSSLVDKGYLEADGVGRGTKYYLSEIFKSENYIKDQAINSKPNPFKEIKLSDEEIKILQFIKEKGYINNTLSRTELGLKKHRSVDLFNGLLLKNKIVRTGSGNKIKYILSEDRE